MTHFFDRRDYWGNRLSVWVVVLMAFATPLCVWSLWRIHLSENVDNWLADYESEIRARDWVRQVFPIGEQVLVSWNDSSINDARITPLVESLIGKTDEQGVRRGGSPYVSSVIEPTHELIAMQQNGIEPQEAVRRLQGTIIGVGPLRVKLTETGRAALRKTRHAIKTGLEKQFGIEVHVTEAAADLLSQTSIPTGFENGQAKEPCPPAVLSPEGNVTAGASLEYDLQLGFKGLRSGDETTVAVANWLTKFVPERQDESLVESVFFAPGSPIALSIGISEAGLADKRETIAAIRSACRQAGIPDESLHLAGGVVTTAALNSEINRVIWNPAYPLVQIHRCSPLLTSLLICGVLAMAVLRNLRLTILALGAALLSTGLTLSTIPALGGSLNLFQTTLPALILAIAVAGSIHVMNYWRISALRNPGQAIAETAQTSWTPIIAGCLAMAIGFGSLSVSPLLPVRDFGRFAALGCLITMVTLTFGLPSLLQIWKATPKSQSTEHSGWRLFGQMLTIRPGLQSYATVAICIGCGIGLTRYHADSRWTQLLPRGSQVDQDNAFFETNLAGVTPLDLIVRFDQQALRDANFVDRMELVRKVQEKMRQHPAISGTSSIVDLQPVNQTGAENVSFLQRTKLNKQAANIEQRFHDGDIAGLRRFHTVAETDSSLDLPGKQQFCKVGDELWRITAQVRVMNDKSAVATLEQLNATMQEVLKLQPGSQHLVAGNLAIFARIQSAIAATLKGSFLLTLAVSFALMLMTVRNFGAALITMVAQLAPISVVLGIVSWLKQPMEIGSMIAAPISLGIATFGAIQFLTHFRNGMKTGKSLREAMVEALVDCGSANFQAFAIVALSMLAFTHVGLPPINHLGWITASMVGVGLIINTALLPLLVCGPAGKLFECAKAIDIKPALVEQPVAMLDSSAIATVIPNATIPSPHIKSDEAPKKRRSTSRRDRDAG